MVIVLPRCLRDDDAVTRLRGLAFAASALLTITACTTSDPTASTQTSEATSTAATVASSTTSTTIPTTTSAPSTTTTAPTTTSSSTTTVTTSSTTTTTPTTTTASDPPPAAVGGLTVGIGGGSGEVIPEWDRNSEPDVTAYNLWYSDYPGATKTLLATLPHDPTALPGPAYDAGGGRTAYVDLRAQIEGKHCYQVSAIDAGGHEGQRSSEVCLPFTPPSVPAGFSVGIGGGSGEVMIAWTRIPDPDAASYNLWFSEWPGDAKTLLASVDHDPTALVGPAYNAGGGRTAYIDFPRMLENDRNCYQISSVDNTEIESSRTGELCLSDL